MSDPLAASFDALPYRNGAITISHPARIGAIARLLGSKAAAPDRCRVLELGCGIGMNLLPLAERLPEASFVGVDFSPGQIALAEEARGAAGLTNVQFICADLREFEPETGAFDNVIAAGVYSWVPEEVRERVLAIVARALSPEGVAFVSYNVHPAWGILGSLRAILRTEMERIPDPQAHIAHLLPALESAFAAQAGPFAQLMREALATMRATPPELLFHDDLESENHPTTFLEFTAHASRHGLHYLAEAEFGSLPFEHLPAEVRAPLADLHLDFARQQQFLDLLGNRRLRSSLLVRTPVPASRPVDPAAVADCSVRLLLWPEGGRIDLAGGAALQLQGRHQFRLSVERPELKAFFAALCEARPAPVAFSAAITRATELLAQVGIAASPDATQLVLGLVRLFAIDQCDLLLTGDGRWLHDPGSSQASALVRYQAAHGLQITNRWHENVEVTGDERCWLAGEVVEVNAAALLRAGLGA